MDTDVNLCSNFVTKNPQFPTDFVTFIEEILNGKLLFFAQCVQCAYFLPEQTFPPLSMAISIGVCLDLPSSCSLLGFAKCCLEQCSNNGFATPTSAFLGRFCNFIRACA